MVRRRYHLHVPGVIYVLTTFLMSIGAINSQNNLLFWAFGLAVTALIVSGVLSGSALMGLEVTREPIAETNVGEPLVIRYRLRNRNRLMPAFGLTLAESDRAITTKTAPTWTKHTATPRAFVVEVGAGRSIPVEAISEATRRGEPTFDALTVTTTFPFGLMRKSVIFAAPARAIIRPRRLHLRPDLLGSLVRRGTQAGMTRTVSRTGEEFFTLREYRPGDHTSAVAWRASAKAGDWLVRAHAQPGPRRFWIVVDANASDADNAEQAISLAASLAIAGHDQGFLVGVQAPAVGLTITPRHSPAALRTMLNALAVVDLAQTATSPGASASSERDSVVIVHADAARAETGSANASHLVVQRLPEYLDANAAQPVTPVKEVAA